MTPPRANRIPLEYHVKESGPTTVIAVLSGLRRTIGHFPDKETAVATMARWAASPEGWIYFMRDGHNVKIGRTVRSPLVRLSACQTSNVRPLKLEYVLEVKRTEVKAKEIAMHRHWHARRVAGEWFRITPDELTEFVSGEALRIVAGGFVWPREDKPEAISRRFATEAGEMPDGDDPKFAEKYVEHMAARRAQPSEVISPLTLDELDELEGLLKTGRKAEPDGR